MRVEYVVKSSRVGITFFLKCVYKIYKTMMQQNFRYREILIDRQRKMFDQSNLEFDGIGR